MDKLSERIQELGAAVREVSDASADPSALAAARRRFLASASSPARRGARRSILVALAAAACLALVAVVLVRREGAALSFDVGAPPVAGAVGDWVAAEHDAPLGVRFSEGTRVTLAPGARIRVTEISASGAGLLIERGTVHAEVHHQGRDTRWAVRAGPFEVKVTGTTFDAGWDPTTEVFELSMAEGSVGVSGPLVPTGRVVVAGERLRIAVREGRMELTTSRDAAGAVGEPTAPVPAQPATTAGPIAPEPAVAGGESGPAIAGAGSGPAAAGAGSGPATGSSSAAPAAVAEDVAWQKLAAAGKYREALEAAERRGFAQELERGSSAELLSLSDTARFAGSPARAREALLAMRRRFGAKGRSAFLLGKIAADQQGSPGEASTWFETYLREEPGGPLAEQALGRLLEIKKRAGPEAARPIAERYLAAYPNGAYAGLARSVLPP